MMISNPFQVLSDMELSLSAILSLILLTHPYNLQVSLQD